MSAAGGHGGVALLVAQWAPLLGGRHHVRHQLGVAQDRAERRQLRVIGLAGYGHLDEGGRIAPPPVNSQRLARTMIRSSKWVAFGIPLGRDRARSLRMRAAYRGRYGSPAVTVNATVNTCGSPCEA
jgi:hypothetical protein